MIGSNRKSARRLLARAMEQGSYFTAKQAAAAGYGYAHLDYHVSVGNFKRIDHGLYRLTSLPLAENDDLVRLSLWSRNREDQPQAVVSHESALVVHELSELLPKNVHLTVPPTFRKVPPAGCILHKATLPPGDIEERQGFLLTTALRTLLDAAAASTSTEQLEKAVNQALETGQVRRSKLAEAVRQTARYRRLRSILEQHSTTSV